jgi:quercetin dioxygenase-like cupin family protein
MADVGAVRWAAAEPVEMRPGIVRRTLAETADAQLVEIRAQAGAQVELHSHPAQQITYVISGQVDLTLDGATHSILPGDTCAIPGGMEHSAYFPVETMLVDCFSPPRVEYR